MCGSNYECTFFADERRGELKRVLVCDRQVPCLSKISFNEGENVPGIAHAVVLEVLENR